MSTDICSLSSVSSSVHTQTANRSLSITFPLHIPHLDSEVPPPACIWYSKKEATRWVCLVSISKGEFMFRLVAFQQTWPMITRDGEGAGLSFAGSLQFNWVSIAWTGKHSMKLQSSANTFIITAAKPVVLPSLHSPWPIISIPTCSSHF